MIEVRKKLKKRVSTVVDRNVDRVIEGLDTPASDLENKPTKICKLCLWWGDRFGGKEKCWKPDACDAYYSCKKWRAKDSGENLSCTSCKFFKNWEECDSTDPRHSCLDHELIGLLPTLPDKGEVRQMLKDGISPIEIGKRLDIQLSYTDKELTVNDPQAIILKHHLNTVFTILPSAELQARIDPRMNNVYAVTALIGASREILEDLNNYTDPKELYNKIEGMVIEPMTTKFLETISLNLGDARAKLRDYVQDNKRDVLELTIQKTLKDMGSEMQKIMLTHLDKLKTLTGIQEE
jgi:hypothetical protein